MGDGRVSGAEQAASPVEDVAVLAGGALVIALRALHRCEVGLHDAGALDLIDPAGTVICGVTYTIVFTRV